MQKETFSLNISDPFHWACSALDEIEIVLGLLKTLWRSCRYQESEVLNDDGHQTSCVDMSLGGHAVTIEHAIEALSEARECLQKAKVGMRERTPKDASYAVLEACQRVAEQLSEQLNSLNAK